MAYITDSFDDEIVKFLEIGGTGVLPTDTIYGLSCRALEETAVNRIRGLKGRDKKKSFIILVSDIKMLDLLSISKRQAKQISKYWPGPLSAVFKAAKAPDWLRAADGTLAVRLPDYTELIDVIEKVGPIISTSANLAGGSPASTIDDAQEYFGENLDFYVDAGPLNNPPSTLVSVVDAEIKLLRQGSVNINT